MGYESTVYVCRKAVTGYLETIACVEMCKMGYDNGWHDLFKKELNKENDRWYGIDNFSDNDCVYEDCYGDSIKYSDVKTVVDWLKKERERTNNEYRRLDILLGLLESFDPNRWRNLLVVHYGH